MTNGATTWLLGAADWHLHRTQDAVKRPALCLRSDIKPENVFFTSEGGVRLGDFGLAIDSAKERPTSRVGTLDYM